MTNKLLLTAMFSLPIFALASETNSGNQQQSAMPVATQDIQIPVQNQSTPKQLVQPASSGSQIINSSQVMNNQQGQVVIQKPQQQPNTLNGVTVKRVAQVPQNTLELSDQRVTRVNYDTNKVVTIYANPFVSTTIELSKDEVVMADNITNGDSSSWNYQVYADKPNYLGIKPSRIGSDTSMTIVTNQHTYYFHLISTDQIPAMFAIKYEYPDAEIKNTNAKKQFVEQQNKANLSSFRNPSEYNMNYTFSGDKNIMPIQVWDDGQVTYMQFSPNQPQPAIFAVEGEEGDEAVVNYRRLDNNLVIVLRVAPQFTLRLGSEQVSSIFNQTYIKQIKEKQSNYHNKNFFESTLSYFQSKDIADSNDI